MQLSPIQDGTSPVEVARGVDETMNVTRRTSPGVHTVQRDSVCFTCLTPPVGVTQKQQAGHGRESSW